MHPMDKMLELPAVRLEKTVPGPDGNGDTVFESPKDLRKNKMKGRRMALAITVTELDGGAVVCELTGSLDASAAEEFEAVFLPLTENPSIHRIILNGSGLDYIASAGLRIFLKAVKTLEARKAELYGANLTGTVKSVLKITGFFRYIEERDTIADCLP